MTWLRFQKTSKDDGVIARRYVTLGLAASAAVSCAAAPSAGQRTVAVVGATGGTGKFIIADLAARGFKVRALTRDPVKARASIAGPYEWLAGDVREPRSLAAAFQGADFVITSVGTTEASGANSPEKVDWDGGRNAVDAARSAGVTRFVMISSANAGNPESPLNKMFGNVLVWKGKAEQYLRQSGVDYSIIRGPGLIDDPGGVKEIILEQSGTERRTCTRQDLAAVTVVAMTDAAAGHKTMVARNGDGPFRADWVRQFAARDRD